MKPTCILTTAVAMLMPLVNSYAQLTGVIKNKANTPVANAVVRYGGAKTLTDTGGRFSIACNGQGELSVSHAGFAAIVKRIENCAQEVEIVMEPFSRDIEEVIITATSNPNKEQLSLPVSVVRLTEREIKRGTGIYMDDAVNVNVPGVTMERRTISGGQQFNIRGYGNGARGTNGVSSNFDGQGYKVYLNGISLTDAEGITQLDDIDFGTVSNVEIVKGPAGTLYGQAIAGVVNLETQPAEKGKISISQDVMAGSYGLQRYTTRVQIGGERSSVNVSYGKQLYDGFMPHTASHKDFVNITGDFRPNDKQTINTYVGYSNSYDQRNGELTSGQYDSMRYTGNPAYIANDAHSAVISFRAGVGQTYKFNDNISNTTALFGAGVSNNASSAGGWTIKNPANYGFRSTIDTRYKAGNSLTLTGITGIEAQSQNAHTRGYGMVKDSTNPTGYNIIGAMRSNVYTLSNTYAAFTEWTLAMSRGFSVTGGIGISALSMQLNDQLDIVANNNPNGTGTPRKYEASYNNMLSPHLAVNKLIKQHVSVYASYSSGYKAPVSSYFYIPLTGQVNTNLKPEKGTQIEVGSKGMVMAGKLYYAVAVFNAVFARKMTVVAVPNAANTATSYVYMVNGGEQNNTGAEALIKYTAYSTQHGFITSISPFANVAYAHFRYGDFRFQQLSTDKTGIVETDYSNKTVAGVPAVTFNAGADLQTKSGLYANVTYSYRDGMYYTSDNLNKTASYNVLNAKAGIRKTLFGFLTCDLYLGANNMTGTQYPMMVFVNQLPDAYLPAPKEINYFGGVSIKYTF